MDRSSGMDWDSPAHRSTGMSPSSTQYPNSSFMTTSSQQHPEPYLKNERSPMRAGAHSGSPQNRHPLPKRSDVFSGQQRGNTPNRVSRACNRCRRAKTKCSGTDPCRACHAIDKECVYSTGKVELQKRQTEMLVAENEELRSILSTLDRGSTLTAGDRKRIKRVLTTSSMADNLAQEAAGNNISDTLYLPSLLRTESSSSPGSIDVRNSVHSSMSQGYEYEKDQTRRPAFQPEATHQTFDTSNDPYALPSDGIADVLVNEYLRSIHEYFPVCDPDDLQAGLKTFTQSDNRRPSRDLVASLGIVNMVMALSSHRLQLTEHTSHVMLTAHELYSQRARPLFINDWEPTRPMNCRWIVYLALVGLYTLEQGNLESAWASVGLAIRFAIYLGYHQGLDSSLAGSDSNHTHRIWLSLCCLEAHLCSIRMLSSCVDAETFGCSANCNDSATQQHDLDISQADVVTSNVHTTVFGYIAQLSSIKQAINAYIQQPKNQVNHANFSAANFRQGAGDYDARLASWAQSLPANLQLSDRSSSKAQGVDLRQLYLLLAFYSAKMSLCRPFLWVQKKELRSEHASRHSWTSGCYYAETCLSTAASIIKAIDRLSSPAEFFKVPAIWNSTQTLCQAGEAILYEHQCDLRGNMSSDKFEMASTIIKWLEVAERTSNIAGDLRQSYCDTLGSNS